MRGILNPKVTDTHRDYELYNTFDELRKDLKPVPDLEVVIKRNHLQKAEAWANTHKQSFSSKFHEHNSKITFELAGDLSDGIVDVVRVTCSSCKLGTRISIEKEAN